MKELRRLVYSRNPGEPFEEGAEFSRPDTPPPLKWLGAASGGAEITEGGSRASATLGGGQGG
jgi:hypothetical protein